MNQSQKPLICIVGSLNIDFVTTTPRCPAAGETLTASSLEIAAGGKGANQAVGCGRASFISPTNRDVEVEMVGAIGKGDVYAEKLLLPLMRSSGVGLSGVSELDGKQTGTASIVVESASGENRIMVVPGSNHDGMGNFDEVLSRTVRNGRVPDVVVMQGEIPRTTVLQLLRHFNGNDSTAKVVFNPAPVFPEGIPKDALDGLELLVVNEGESIMLGKALQGEGFDLTGVESENDLHDEIVLNKLTQQLHTLMKIKIVLITLGGRGAFYSDSRSGQSGLVAGVKVPKVIDTTAAGDTFVGYVAAALARHSSNESGEDFPIEQAIKQANTAAAKCVQRVGAMQSIPFGYE